MTDITINIDKEGDEPKVTTTTEIADGAIPKIEPSKADVPQEQHKEITPKMDMTDEEYSKMSAEKPSEKEPSKDESSKKGDEKRKAI